MAKARARRSDTPFAYALLLPSLLILALVAGFPLVLSIWQSLTRVNDAVDPQTGFIEEGDHFVGLANYTAVFTDPDTSHAFWNAAWNTTMFTVVGVTIETIIGVGMALLMAKAFRGRGLVRAGILVPWAIPTIVSALVWKLIFDANGVANRLLGQQVLWTTEGWQAQVAVLVADCWKTAPYIGLLALAGLQTIDRDVYEAARIDGASAWKQFWQITLPLLRPVLVVAILFRMLDALRMFDLPYGLLGRNKSGETLSLLAYYEANQTRYGQAAAYSVILFAYTCLVAFLFVRLAGADLIGDPSGDEPARKRHWWRRGGSPEARAVAATPAALTHPARESSTMAAGASTRKEGLDHA